MKILPIVNITIAVLLTSLGCEVCAANTIALPSGSEVTLLGAELTHFAGGNGQALLLRYATSKKLSDKPVLATEADDVWDGVRSQVEKSGQSVAILSANDKEGMVAIQPDHCVNFVIQKDAKGSWYCSNDKVVTVGGPAKILYKQALQLMSQNHFREGVAKYDELLALDPTYVQAYIDRGAAYGILNQPAKALADLDKAISLSPSNVHAYINRSEVYGQQKQYQKAIDDCTRAMTFQADPAAMSGAYANRGEAYVKMGLYEKGIDDLTKSIASHPQPAESYYYRSLAYSKIGKMELATRDKARADELGYKVDDQTVVIDGK